MRHQKTLIFLLIFLSISFLWLFCSTPVKPPKEDPAKIVNQTIIVKGTLEKGTYLSMFVQVTGESLIKYRWFKDSVIINGETIDTLKIDTLSEGDNGAYTCVVSNTYGSDTSKVFYLKTIYVDTTKPTILLNQPSDSAIVQDSVLFVNFKIKDESGISFVSINGISKSITNSIYLDTIKLDSGYNSIVAIAIDNSTEKNVDTLITIILYTKNAAPVWKENPVLDTINEGTAFTVNLSDICSDPENDSIVFTMNAGDPVGDTIIGKIYSFTSSFSDEGDYGITFYATDGSQSTSTVLKLSVLNVNQKPKFETDFPKNSYLVPEGEKLLVNFNAIDLDSDSLSYSLLENTLPRPTTLLFDTITKTIKWNSLVNDKGLYEIIILATDGKSIDTAKIMIGVGAVNLPPEISITGIAIVNGGTIITELQTLSFTVTVSDPNNGDSFVLFQVQNAPQGTVYDTTTGVFAYTPSLSVTGKKENTSFSNIKFIAADNVDANGFDTFVVSIEVLDSNSTPTAVNDTVVCKEDNSVIIAVLTNDTDVDISLDSDSIIILSTTNPDHGSVQLSNGSITYIPNDNYFGNDIFTYTIRDLKGATSVASVYLTVTAVNDKPVIDSMITAIEIVESITSMIISKFSDPDGTTPVISSIVTGGFNSIKISNNIISFTPDFNAVVSAANKLYPVVFKIMDAEDTAVFVNHTVIVTVVDSNRTPTVTFPSNSNIGIGNDYVGDLPINDPDGDVVTVSFDVNGFTYNNGKVYWHVDRAIQKFGAVITVNATVSDGKNLVQGSWNLTIVEHVWDAIGQIDDLHGFCASDSDEVFAYTVKEDGYDMIFKTSKYVDGGKTFSGITYTVDLYSSQNSGFLSGDYMLCGDSVYMQIHYTSQGNDSLFWYLLNASNLNAIDTFKIKVNPAVVYSIEPIRSNGNIISVYYDYTPNKFVIDDPDFLYKKELSTVPIWDIESSYKGVNVLLSANKFWEIYQKAGSGNAWVKIKEAGPSFNIGLSQIEMASDYGDTIYFLNNSDSTLYWCVDGQSSVSIKKIEDSGNNSGIFTKIASIDAVSGSVCWVINKFGEVHFTNDCFQSTHRSSLVSIKEIIIADDRKAVYARTEDGNIFRY